MIFRSTIAASSSRLADPGVVRAAFGAAASILFVLFAEHTPSMVVGDAASELAARVGVLYVAAVRSWLLVGLLSLFIRCHFLVKDFLACEIQDVRAYLGIVWGRAHVSSLGGPWKSIEVCILSE